MVCPCCGREVDAHNSFCTYCGKILLKMKEVAQQSITSQAFCRSCGHQNEVSNGFCTHCGNDFNRGFTPRKPMSRQYSNKSIGKRKLLILSSIVVVLLVIIIIVVPNGSRLSGTWVAVGPVGGEFTIRFTRFSFTQTVPHPYVGYGSWSGSYEISGDHIRLTWKEGFDERESTGRINRIDDTIRMGSLVYTRRR